MFCSSRAQSFTKNLKDRIFTKEFVINDLINAMIYTGLQNCSKLNSHTNSYAAVNAMSILSQEWSDSLGMLKN